MSVVVDDVVELRPLTSGDLPAVDRLERELFGPAAWSPAMLAEELGGPDRWYLAAVERAPLGGATLYAADLAPAAGAPLDPDPAVLGRLALARLVGAPEGTVLASEPLYLRRPDVTPPTERKRASA